MEKLTHINLTKQKINNYIEGLNNTTTTLTQMTFIRHYIQLQNTYSFQINCRTIKEISTDFEILSLTKYTFSK